MSTAVIILFIADTLIHLYACYNRKRGLRMATKPLLLALLAVYYALAAKTFMPTVLIALLLGLVGDILLLVPEKPKFFLAGAFSFGVGHLFYIYTLFFKTPYSSLPFEPLYLLLVIPYALAMVLIFKKLMPHLKESFRFLMPLYMAIINVMSAGTVIYLSHTFGSNAPMLFPLLMAIGSLFFITSDTILAFSVFRGGVKRDNFYIMLTYIIAQACLTLGFVNM